MKSFSCSQLRMLLFVFNQVPCQDPPSWNTKCLRSLVDCVNFRFSRWTQAAAAVAIIFTFRVGGRLAPVGAVCIVYFCLHFYARPFSSFLWLRKSHGHVPDQLLLLITSNGWESLFEDLSMHFLEKRICQKRLCIKMMIKILDRKPFQPTLQNLVIEIGEECGSIFFLSWWIASPLTFVLCGIPSVRHFGFGPIFKCLFRNDGFGL